MKFVGLGRRAGKTVEMIKMSAASGSYVVCHSQREAHRIFREASGMGLSIPFPITFAEFKRGEFHPVGVRGLLIDNVDLLLQDLARGAPVHAVTFTPPPGNAE